ncbi:hypothetical protein [Caballeronia sp. KNU42]
MPAPSTKAPSKKAFHFPKTAETAEPAVSKRKAIAKAAVEAAKESEGKAVQVPAKSKAKAAPAESVAAEEKVKRPKKEKVVRDSFTMPKSDYDKIGLLKQKCLANGVHVKKGELLRAGLLILERANLEQLTAAVAAVETVKTGRPGKS